MVFRLGVQVLANMCNKWSGTEIYLDKQRKGIELPKRATAPWPIDCASDLDDSPESNTINLL